MWAVTVAVAVVVLAVLAVVHRYWMARRAHGGQSLREWSADLDYLGRRIAQRQPDGTWRIGTVVEVSRALPTHGLRVGWDGGDHSWVPWVILRSSDVRLYVNYELGAALPPERIGEEEPSDTIDDGSSRRARRRAA